MCFQDKNRGDDAKDFDIGFLDACNCHEIHNSSKYTYIQRHG